MNRRPSPTAPPWSVRDDAPEAMREWRWRCYADHLADLGYDLDGGQRNEEDPVGTGRSASESRSLVSSAAR